MARRVGKPSYNSIGSARAPFALSSDLMKLGYVIAYVPDVRRAVDFYEQAFGFARRFVDETGSYAELVSGETTLSFASESMAHSNGVNIVPTRIKDAAPAIELALVTEQLHADFERACRAGAVPIQAPAAKPWGQSVAYVRDLDGVLVELCTPVQKP